MRANNWSFLKALPYGILACICLTALASPYSDEDTAYLAGRMTWYSLVGTVIVWLIARYSSKEWRWWVWPLVTIPLVFAVALILATLTAQGEAVRD